MDFPLVLLCNMISHLSISLLWRLENALLHKTFLSKCFLTEVLPLPLLLLTLREKRMLNCSHHYLMANSQPPSQSLPTLPSSSPSWLSSIHFWMPPAPSCSSPSSEETNIIKALVKKYNSVLFFSSEGNPRLPEHEQLLCRWRGV